MSRRLLEIADRIRARASTGRYYTEGPFDRARYETLLELAAEMAALATGAEPETVARLYRDPDPGYATPKLDARLAVFRDGRLLLVRERSDGLWSLPGGYVDVGDSPSEAAVRETAEEAGVEAKVERLAGVFDTRLQPDCPALLFHIHKLVFSGRLVDSRAEPRAGDETSEAAFFAPDALPELSLGRTLPLHIEQALRVARDPSALPWFD